MATLRWLPEALEDVQRLHAFLHDKSPEAAKHAIGVILQGAQLLEATPRLGRPLPDETGRRELFMAFGAGAYVLRYMTQDETVIIIRIWHSRESRTQ